MLLCSSTSTPIKSRAVKICSRNLRTPASLSLGFMISDYKRNKIPAAHSISLMRHNILWSLKQCTFDVRRSNGVAWNLYYEITKANLCKLISISAKLMGSLLIKSSNGEANGEFWYQTTFYYPRMLAEALSINSSVDGSNNGSEMAKMALKGERIELPKSSGNHWTSYVNELCFILFLLR